MTVIYLAGNRITPFINFPIIGITPVATAFGHLQLVREINGDLDEIEVQAPSGQDVSNPFNGNWVFELANEDHTLYSNTYGYGNSDFYSWVSLDIGDRNADDIWSIFEQVHAQYLSSAVRPEYNILFNSNSYANTLLSVIGMSAGAYTGSLNITWSNGPLQFYGYPGAGGNALLSEDTAIALTLSGGVNKDRIYGGILGDSISGNDEDDYLSGGVGNDSLFGGSGVDIIYGREDNDFIDGGLGANASGSKRRVGKTHVFLW
jgi:Ca2+-binding RTX toxin-like protein